MSEGSGQPARIRPHVAGLGDVASQGGLIGRQTAISRPGTAITLTADTVLCDLMAHPRSFLLMHLAPMLPHHPEIQQPIAVDAAGIQRDWAEGYLQLMDAFGVQLRPEWTMERLSLVLQMLLDGHMLRSRVDPDLVQATRWESASLFATAVVTFIVGTIDHDKSGRTAARYLDDETTPM